MALPPDEPTDEEQQQQLPNDGPTPAAMPDDTNSTANDSLGDSHPATDTNFTNEEAYDEGTSGAAEATEPASGGVGGYNPPADDQSGQASDQTGQNPQEDAQAGDGTGEGSPS